MFGNIDASREAASNASSRLTGGSTNAPYCSVALPPPQQPVVQPTPDVEKYCRQPSSEPPLRMHLQKPGGYAHGFAVHSCSGLPMGMLMPDAMGTDGSLPS